MKWKDNGKEMSRRNRSVSHPRVYAAGGAGDRDGK